MEVSTIDDYAKVLTLQTEIEYSVLRMSESPTKQRQKSRKDKNAERVLLKVSLFWPTKQNIWHWEKG